MGKRMNSTGDDMTRIGRSLPLLQPVTFHGPDRVVIEGPAPAREAPFEVLGRPHVRRSPPSLGRTCRATRPTHRASGLTRRATDSRGTLGHWPPAIDGPDGLVADLGHLLTRRGCVTTRIRVDRHTPRRGLCAGWSAPRPDNRTTTARPPSPPRDRPISNHRIRDRG